MVWRRRSASATRSASSRRWPAARPTAGASVALPKPVVVRAPEPAGGGTATHLHAHAALAPHGGRYDDILDAIGHTPIVEIPRLSPNPAHRLLHKLDIGTP